MKRRVGRRGPRILTIDVAWPLSSLYRFVSLQYYLIEFKSGRFSSPFSLRLSLLLSLLPAWQHERGMCSRIYSLMSSTSSTSS